jgi:hypothetical protein
MSINYNHMSTLCASGNDRIKMIYSKLYILNKKNYLNMKKNINALKQSSYPEQTGGGGCSNNPNNPNDPNTNGADDDNGSCGGKSYD